MTGNEREVLMSLIVEICRLESNVRRTQLLTSNARDDCLTLGYKQPKRIR